MFTYPCLGIKFSEPNLWFRDECSALLQLLLKGILLVQLSRFATQVNVLAFEGL